MIGEAAQPVRTKRIGALVVSRDSERIEGLFSERDIVSDLPRHGERLLRLTVADVISTRSSPARRRTRSRP